MSNELFYLSELKSEECFCGKSKKSKFSFCFNCFRELPSDIRKRLYNKIGNGYEEAYDDAIVYLKDII